MDTTNTPPRASSELARLLCDLLDAGVSKHELIDALEECVTLLHNVAEVRT